MSSTIALVIGISHYPADQYAPLPAAQIDAIHFARALTHWGVSEITLLLNEHATIDQLSKWFASLSQREGDFKLICCFCGHGEREAGAIPHSYFLFFDGRMDLDSLIHNICQSKAKESYIFLDACSLRINNLLNPKLEEEIQGHKISQKNLFCLLSSGVQESFENNRYGYFTNALLKSLAQSRTTELDSSQLFGNICKLLKMEDLPLPELYNIGNQKISFFPSFQPFFDAHDLLYRSEMIGKIEDALILNQGKVGVLLGEKGCGKTSLCRLLVNPIYKIFYLEIPLPPSPSIDFINLFIDPFRHKAYAGSLLLMDQAENLYPDQLRWLIEQMADSALQLLIVSNQSLEDKLPLSLQNQLFEIAIDPLSHEEAKQLMLPFSHTDKEKKLIYLAAKGNPLKMQQIAYCLSQRTIAADAAEKEEMLKTVAALHRCGCYLDKELFAKVFELSLSAIASFEQLGLVCWDAGAWVPDSIFYEIAESKLPSIPKEKVLEYWYRQIAKTPNQIWAATNLISSVRRFGYEKKGDRYLMLAFQSLLQDGRDHSDLFIEGVQIFQSLSEPTEASTFLANILTDLKRLDLTFMLQKEKVRKTQKLWPIWIGCLFIAFLGFFFFNPWSTPPIHVVNLKQVHPDFVGRDSYLHQLKEVCLKRATQPSVAVLWGEAGIGKSEIAIAFANLCAKSFRLICWIDGETEESRSASYDNIAHLLKITVNPEQELAVQVHDYLEKEKSIQPWLLIFDNASKKTILPSKGKGSIVITTRNRTPWQSYCCTEVTHFQEKEAIDLFKKITRNPESIPVHSLVNRLDYFPLTLNLAAHYIAETPEMNEELYLDLISRHNVDFISNMPLDTRYPNPLLSSWNITAAELADKNPETLLWLHFCSYLAPSDIPSAWVEKWLADIQKETNSLKIKILSRDILRTLVNQCLMRFEKTTHCLSLHQLKQDVIRKDRYFQSEMADQVAQFLIFRSGNVEKIYEGKIHPSQWVDLKEWEPHAAWFVNNYGSECSKENLASLQNLLGNWKYLKGNYKAAQSYHEKALKNRIESLGPEHPSTVISINNLAMILWENGQFAESKDLFSQALEILKKSSKEDHLDIIVSLNNLGWVNWEMGKFQEAKTLLNQSLHLSKKLDACDPDFLQTVNDFLVFLDEETTKDQGSDTEKLTKRALFLRHAGLWIAEVEGNPTKSLSYFEKSLELLKKALPEEDPRIAIAYGSVGIGLNRAARSEEGQTYLFKAFELQKKLLGEEHPETAKSYANFAISQFNLGKYQQALAYHLKALEIRRRALGEEHPITAKSYSGTGNALIGLQKYKEALFYNQKALEIRQKSLGDNHSETAQSYSRLAVNLSKLGRCEEALSYHLKALEILNRIFGESHYLTAKIHTALRDFYRDLGNMEKALDHEQKAKEIWKLF